jgi:multisubunit Na+/H+ antiporter MnhG subunit
MKVWMIPWMFPLALLGTVICFSLITPIQLAIVVLVVWLIIPIGAMFAYERSRDPSQNDDADYWRFDRFW